MATYKKNKNSFDSTKYLDNTYEQNKQYEIMYKGNNVMLTLSDNPWYLNKNNCSTETSSNIRNKIYKTQITNKEQFTQETTTSKLLTNPVCWIILLIIILIILLIWLFSRNSSQ